MMKSLSLVSTLKRCSLVPCRSASGRLPFAAVIYLSMMGLMAISTPVKSQQLEGLLFDFESGTAEGWVNVLSDPDLPHVFTPTDARSENGELFPVPASGSYQVLPIEFENKNRITNTRDGTHKTLLMRSPEFVLVGGALSIAIVGGEAHGQLPSGPADLATATDASDGLHVQGFGVRRVSDETYIATGARSHNGSSYQTLVIPAAALAPFVSTTETYTIDVFDSFAGSWGWIGFDRVWVPGKLAGGPYFQDFESFENGVTEFEDGSILTSNRPAAVGVRDNALQLTSDHITHTRTTFLTPPMNLLTAGFRACFDYNIFDAPDEIINDLPADGFSFNIGAIVPASEGDEEGFGTGLSIEFDTHSGGGSDIIGHNVAVNGVDVPGGSNGVHPKVDGEWHTVCIEWVNGAVTVSVDGSDLFRNLPTPGFTPSPAYVFAFAARTGGATETVLIDNISITPPAPEPTLELVVPEIGIVVFDGLPNHEFEFVNAARLDLPYGSAPGAPASGLAVLAHDDDYLYIGAEIPENSVNWGEASSEIRLYFDPTFSRLTQPGTDHWYLGFKPYAAKPNPQWFRGDESGTFSPVASPPFDWGAIVEKSGDDVQFDYSFEVRVSREFLGSFDEIDGFSIEHREPDQSFLAPENAVPDSPLTWARLTYSSNSPELARVRTEGSVQSRRQGSSARPLAGQIVRLTVQGLVYDVETDATGRFEFDVPVPANREILIALGNHFPMKPDIRDGSEVSAIGDQPTDLLPQDPPDAYRFPGCEIGTSCTLAGITFNLLEPPSADFTVSDIRRQFAPAIALDGYYYFTASTSDVITTATTHGFSIGDRVQVAPSNTLPKGLNASTDYFVRTVPTASSLTLSVLAGGAAVDITDAGKGPYRIAGDTIPLGDDGRRPFVEINSGFDGAVDTQAIPGDTQFILVGDGSRSAWPRVAFPSTGGLRGTPGSTIRIEGEHLHHLMTAHMNNNEVFFDPEDAHKLEFIQVDRNGRWVDFRLPALELSDLPGMAFLRLRDDWLRPGVTSLKTVSQPFVFREPPYPYLNGFGWQNGGEPSSYNEFLAVYGNNAYYCVGALGVCLTRIPDPFYHAIWWPIYNVIGPGEDGLCVGMVSTSLLFDQGSIQTEQFAAGVMFPAAWNEKEESARFEYNGLLGPATGPPRPVNHLAEIQRNHGVQTSAEYIQSWLTDIALGSLSVKNEIRSNPARRVVCFKPSDSFAGHCVAPFGSHTLTLNQSLFEIYDPNYPSEIRYLTVDSNGYRLMKADSQWQGEVITASPLSIWTSARSHPLNLLRPDSTVELLYSIISGDANALYEDRQGRQWGWDGSGQFIDTMPDATGIAVFDTPESERRNVPVTIPIDSGPIEIAATSRGGVFSLHTGVGGVAFSLDVSDTQIGEKDTLMTSSAGHGSLELQYRPAKQREGLAPRLGMQIGDQQSAVFQLMQIRASQEGTTAFKAVAADRCIEVMNAGPSYSLQIESADGASGRVASLEFGPFAIPADALHRLEIANWPTSSLLRSSIDADGDGVFESVEWVRGRRHPNGLFALLPGDMNNDGAVNHRDIEPLTTAVTSPEDFHNVYPDSNIARGDLNADGVVDSLDLDALRALITMVNPPPVIEWMERLPDNTVRLNVVGLPGQRYVLQASSDLREWGDRQVEENIIGSVQFTDDADVISNGYFRIRVME